MTFSCYVNPAEYGCKISSTTAPHPLHISGLAQPRLQTKTGTSFHTHLQEHSIDRVSSHLVSFQNWNVGAGWQVQYPYLCPDFVLCLEYGQYMSIICPKYVFVPYMTNMCLQNPNFVPVKSIFCPLEPTFVLFSSFLLAKVDWKLVDKNESKYGFHSFPICHLVTLQLDKHWPFSGHTEISSLSTKCPGTTTLQKCMYIMVSAVRTILGQILDRKIPRTSRLGPRPQYVLNSSTLQKWAVAHGPRPTHYPLYVHLGWTLDNLCTKASPPLSVSTKFCNI